MNLGMLVAVLIALSGLGLYLFRLPAPSEVVVPVPAPITAARSEALADPSTRALAHELGRSASKLEAKAERVVVAGASAAAQVASTGRDPYGIVTPERVGRVQKAAVALARDAVGALPDPGPLPAAPAAIAASPIAETDDGSTQVMEGPPGLGWYKYGPAPSPLPPRH